MGLAGLSGLSGLSGIVPGAVAVVPPGGDADAAAFIAAAATLSSTEQSAITNLVSALKTNGTWGKYRLIYPFVGGTASAHALNLKSPANDLLTFSLPTTHSAGGITENGTTGGTLATVSLSYNGILNPSSSHNMSAYFGTPGQGLTNLILYSNLTRGEPYLDAGFRYRSSQDSYLAAGRYLNLQSYSQWLGGAWSRSGYYALHSVSATTSQGRYRNSRGGFVRGDNQNFPHGNSWNSANVTTGVFDVKANGSPISWAALGGALTEAEITADAAAVHAFQQALGRGAAY